MDALKMAKSMLRKLDKPKADRLKAAAAVGAVVLNGRYVDDANGNP